MNKTCLKCGWVISTKASDAYYIWNCTLYVVTIGALTITTEKDAVGGKGKQSQRQNKR